jgi:hypothetical protein
MVTLSENNNFTNLLKSSASFTYNVERSNVLYFAQRVDKLVGYGYPNK